MSRKKQSAEEIKRKASETGFYVHVPASLKTAVMTKCAAEDVFLKQVVIRLLEEWVRS